MSQPISNQYYLLKKGQEAISWDIYNPEPSSEPELFWSKSDYFARVLQVVDRSSVIKNLTFYITFDELNDLPSYGPNVVVIMTGGEGCHIPMYCHKVLAIFKPYGTVPFLGCNPLLKPSFLSFLSLLQYLKNRINHLPGLLNYEFQKILSLVSYKATTPKIFTIPLGYYKQVDLPIKDFKSRVYDVFFAGSTDNDTYIKGSLKSWITQWMKPPKTLARQSMIHNARKVKEKHPDLNVEILQTPGFMSSQTPDAKSYSEQIMNAKICLAPRGTAFETYRFFEAIRYGCIVITEALPSHWFYEGSPAIQVKDWEDLSKVLEDLMGNRELMRKKHQETLMWWTSKCSDVKTGQYIVEKIKTLVEEIA
jgi:hypothetical protein